jgi:group I intron endonuclease
MKKYAGIIYKATNLINGKCYIGKTSNLIKRKSRHKDNALNSKKSTYFYNAIRKYKWDNFKWEVLCECDDELILNVMETMKIIVNNSHWTEGGYNLTWGGDGCPLSEETKRKISIATKGKKKPERTDEHKRKIRELKTGFIFTEESKLKMSMSHKGNTSGMLGKHHTEKSKLKMSESHKKIGGHKHSEETKKKMSINSKGKNLGKEPWNKGKIGIYSNEYRKKLHDSHMKYSETTIQNVLYLKNEGMTYRKISEITNIPIPTIESWIRRCN